MAHDPCLFTDVHGPQLHTGASKIKIHSNVWLIMHLYVLHETCGGLMIGLTGESVVIIAIISAVLRAVSFLKLQEADVNSLGTWMFSSHEPIFWSAEVYRGSMGQLKMTLKCQIFDREELFLRN